LPEIHAAQSATIQAPAATLYDIIADYRDGHPRILPPRFFGTLTVIRGGRGAGTRIRFEMKALGKTNIAEADITEPVPGRELREALASGIITTFLVEPVDASTARVTIDTRYRLPGVRGWFERVIAPRFLRKVYVAELVLLAREAERRLNA